MVPRTRNFVLTALLGGMSIVILLLAVVAAVRPVGVASGGIAFGDAATREYSAEVPPQGPDRAARIKVLQEKIAATTPDTSSVVVPQAVELPPPEPPKVTTTTPVTPEVVQRCAGYTSLTVAWYAPNIAQENREGVRVYSELNATQVTEQIRAVIPLRTWPLTQGSCLPHDVVAIALDGSLIRNSETALYTVFGRDTLVGYTLDGYPLYGVVAAAERDACGGLMVGGQYRYALAADAETLINCYVGVPITLQAS